jgi:aminoglycoside phosphotransferase (APT) family kinase protein
MMVDFELSYPMRNIYEELRAVLSAVGRRINIAVEHARLLHLHSNAIFALPTTGLVVRIATNPDAFDGVTASLRVTRWLAARGFPCVVPADIAGQPFVEGGRIVSIWRYVPTVPEPRPTAAELGWLLRTLHNQPALPDPPARFTDPLSSMANALDECPDVLPSAHRRWLAGRISQLRAAWHTLEFPHPPGLIHGDAHPNNLIRTPTGHTVLGDWDHVAIGPREWDLVQIQYTRRRFGRPADAEIDHFVTSYGRDLRGWPGLPTLVAIREISGLSPYLRTATSKPFSARELAHRLDTLQRHDTATRWTAPSAE